MFAVPNAHHLLRGAPARRAVASLSRFSGQHCALANTLSVSYRFKNVTHPRRRAHSRSGRGTTTDAAENLPRRNTTELATRFERLRPGKASYRWRNGVMRNYTGIGSHIMSISETTFASAATSTLSGAGRAVNGSPERKNKKAVSLRGFDAEPVVAALLEHDQVVHAACRDPQAAALHIGSVSRGLTVTRMRIGSGSVGAAPSDSGAISMRTFLASKFNSRMPAAFALVNCGSTCQLPCSDQALSLRFLGSLVNRVAVAQGGRALETRRACRADVCLWRIAEAHRGLVGENRGVQRYSSGLGERFRMTCSEAAYCLRRNRSSGPYPSHRCTSASLNPTRASGEA